MGSILCSHKTFLAREHQLLTQRFVYVRKQLRDTITAEGDILVSAPSAFQYSDVANH